MIVLGMIDFFEILDTGMILGMIIKKHLIAWLESSRRAPKFIGVLQVQSYQAA